MSTKKKKIKKQLPEMSIELVGQINLVERFKGKRAKRSKLDDEVILKIVVQAIERGIELLHNETLPRPQLDKQPMSPAMKRDAKALLKRMKAEGRGGTVDEYLTQMDRKRG